MKTSLLFPFTAVALLLVLISSPVYAQQLTTTLGGRVLDGDNQQPVPFASVTVVGSDPLIGQTTDEEGYFRLSPVAVGRVAIQISSLGYEERVIPNILLISGKETVLSIELKEAFTTLDEIVVKPDADKSTVRDQMAQLSARNLSIEESNRYAGGIGDPARLVASFAGVASTGDGNNDIIVRGNNPRFVQWRLEGTEIPNPNHFGGEGLTGGPISVLNSRVLANSSFYTGAFPASYGNVLSSVFDVDLRNGNADKREHAFSMGALGVDFTTEGPISRADRSSYLLNYRYSTLGLLDQLGVLSLGGVPRYQDAAFKVFLPSKKWGTISVFGLAGNSRIDSEHTDLAEDDRTTSKYTQRARVGVIGLKQVLPTGKDSYLKTVVSYSENGSESVGFRTYNTTELEKEGFFNLSNAALRVNLSSYYKLHPHHLLTAGVLTTFFRFDFRSELFDEPTQRYLLGQDVGATANLLQAFASWKWRLAENLTLVSGLHLEKTSLNDEVSAEPRASLRYERADGQAFTAGFGIHGNMTSLSNYHAVVYDDEGRPTQPNTGLKLLKARHFVVGYENRLAPQLQLRVEAYYQSLYDIGVERAASSYSLINQQADFSDRPLVSTGRGRNYGVDVTLEKYFSSKYYFLVTGSLYQAKYQGSDRVWRNARFNGHYLTNILVGKEFTAGKTGKNTWSLNGRLNLLGAKHLLDIDLQRSIAAGTEVYDEENAFANRGADVVSLNLAVSYQLNRERVSHSFKLDVQNATNNAAVIQEYYNDINQNVEQNYQLSLLPVLSYTLNF